MSLFYLFKLFVYKKRMPLRGFDHRDIFLIHIFIYICKFKFNMAEKPMVDKIYSSPLGDVAATYGLALSECDIIRVEGQTSVNTSSPDGVYLARRRSLEALAANADEAKCIAVADLQLHLHERCVIQIGTGFKRRPDSE